MWYFAYGSNLNSKAGSRGGAATSGHKPPNLKPGKPAVLDNYRLSFRSQRILGGAASPTSSTTRAST
jgi:hypothetical protein